jgi:outer membrane receptor for ferrienterochelin and colicins
MGGHSRRSCLLLSALMLFFAFPLQAQTQTGVITGTVTDVETLAPLSGVNVQALDAAGQVAARGTTDASGAYRLTGVPAGTYTVVISLLGYETERVADVQVAAGQTVTVPSALPSLALRLNPLVVSASRTQERVLDAPASVGIVDSRAVAERPALTPADHVRAMPGVDVITTGVQSTNIVARGFNNIFSGSLHMLTDHRIAGIPSLRVNLIH